MSREKMFEHWTKLVKHDLAKADDAVTEAERERWLAHAQVALENARIFNKPQPTGAGR